MEIGYKFLGSKIKFDPLKKFNWEGPPPGKHSGYYKSIEKVKFFNANIKHEDFEIDVKVIKWSTGYELNPSVIKGSDFIKTLRTDTRLVARFATVRGHQYVLVPYQIAKLRLPLPVKARLYKTTYQELNFVCERDVKAFLLIECQAIDVDVFQVNWLKGKQIYVQCEHDNFKLLLLYFYLTRILPILKRVYAK